MRTVEQEHEICLDNGFVGWSGRATGICRRRRALSIPAANRGRKLRPWAGQYHGSDPMATHQARLCR
jgi:hypothetical protein